MFRRCHWKRRIRPVPEPREKSSNRALGMPRSRRGAVPQQGRVRAPASGKTKVGREGWEDGMGCQRTNVGAAKVGTRSGVYGLRNSAAFVFHPCARIHAPGMTRVVIALVRGVHRAAQGEDAAPARSGSSAETNARCCFFSARDVKRKTNGQVQVKKIKRRVTPHTSSHPPRRDGAPRRARRCFRTGRTSSDESRPGTRVPVKDRPGVERSVGGEQKHYWKPR